MPKTGHFILHSNALPKLTAGSYELLSEHAGLPFEVEPEHTHFQVAAPRYVMPTEQILSSFPPANAEGAFSDRLPQVVLKRRTLPWERNPAGATTVSETPWLALVVVAEGEAQLSTATDVAQCVTAGTSLLDPTDKDVEQGLYLAVTETVVKKIFPCAADLPLLAHVREVDVNDTELANGDDDGFLAVVLANRLPVFDQANNRPVRYMACLVNLEGQLGALPPPVPPVPTFEFALAQDWTVLAQANLSGGPDALVAGPLQAGLSLPGATLLLSAVPAVAAAAAPSLQGAGSAAAMKINSLDGAAQMGTLPRADEWRRTTGQIAAAARDPDAQRIVRDTMAIGFRLPLEAYALERVLRFPVLAHWSFTTTDGATFEKLMKNLDLSLLGSAPKVQANDNANGEDPPPRLPPPPAGAPPELIETGHIALAHRTRRGDATEAWYRGPCVPFPTPRHGGKAGAPPDEALALAHAADQLRRIIPDGREDLALAAAFEIGRLLALSQLSVVSALMRFRAEQFGAGRVREVLAQVLPFALPPFVGGQRVDLARFGALQMIGRLAQAPAQMLGPQRPLADPGRPLKVSGDLDQLIATGLGVDLAALKKRADAVGTLAALAQTEVPLALPPGRDLPPAVLAPVLRNALAAELRRTLVVAVPGKVAGGPGATVATGMAARAPRGGPDALDRLLEAAADTASGDDDDDENGPGGRP